MSEAVEGIRLGVMQDGITTEHVSSLDACAVIVLPENLAPHLMVAGTPDKLKPLLVYGLLNWPMFLPLGDEEDRLWIEALLNSSVMRDAHEAGFSVVAQESAQSLGARMQDAPAPQRAPYTLTMVDGWARASLSGVAYLAFVAEDDKMLIGRAGAGSQKRLMMEHAIEMLWGRDVLASVLEILEGDMPEGIRTMYRQMLHRMAGQQETIVDYTEQQD